MTTTTLNTRIFAFGDIAGVVDSVVSSESAEIAAAGIAAIEDFLSKQDVAHVTKFQTILTDAFVRLGDEGLGLALRLSSDTEISTAAASKWADIWMETFTALATR